jgi:hypothetical protein
MGGKAATAAAHPNPTTAGAVPCGSRLGQYQGAFALALQPRLQGAFIWERSVWR